MMLYNIKKDYSDDKYSLIRKIPYNSELRKTTVYHDDTMVSLGVT